MGTGTEVKSLAKRYNRRRNLPHLAGRLTEGEDKGKITGYTAADRQLTTLCYRALPYRYSSITPEVLGRMTYELEIITSLGYSDYFLIVWDIVEFARREGIPVMGRGSAAGSIVSYLLGITPVDPLRYNLIFERFLNPERQDPPDIDLDICWKGRDRVLEYVYRRYGREQVAMIGTHVTFRYRAAVREVARAYGLSEKEIAYLTQGLSHHLSGESHRESSRENRTTVSNTPGNTSIREEIYRRAERLLKHPRHTGIHAGGIVVAPFPLANAVPLQRAPKGLVITQYDMHAIEDLGLLKIDLLGQRFLSVLADMTATLRERYGVKFNAHCLPEMTEPMKKLLRTGQTIGIFQIESPGMRGLLKKLKVESFEMIIAASSVIRPGPSDSGMLRHFLLRHAGKEPVETVDPRLKEILSETYGIMLYQEDVIKVANLIAGWSLAEADKLRRSMSGKRTEEPFSQHKDRFIQDAVKNGLPVDAAVEIWRQMESFSGYAFCKAHSAAYAVISMLGLWLKAYFPAEFLAAVMSNYGGFYHTSVYLEEARRRGIQILPPDVNESQPWFTAQDVFPSTLPHKYRIGKPPELKKEPAPPWIRIGLLQVKHLTEQTLRMILKERSKRPFESLEDFCHRTGAGKREVEVLIRCGAFDSLGYTRPVHLWRLELVYQAARKSTGPGLFPQSFGLKKLPMPVLDYPLEKKLRDELELLELTVEAHPLLLYHKTIEEKLRLRGWKVVPARKLSAYTGQQVYVVGWMITTRTTRTRKGETMGFLSLEDRTGTMELVLFPPIYRKFGKMITSRGPYLAKGTVEDDFGHHPITVAYLENLNPRS